MSSQKHGKSEVINLARAFRVPDQVTFQAINDLYRSFDCPRSLACHILLKYGEFDQLVSLDVDPAHYKSAQGFRDAFQATKLLSKNSFLKLSTDRKQVAMAKFSEMEDRCKATNSRFRDLSLDPLYKGPNVSLLHAMVLKIEKILGDYAGEELIDLANWGPGVTTLLKGDHASAVNKFQHEAGITRDLFALLSGDLLSQAYPMWHGHLENLPGFPTFEVGNVVITVPKNAKTDRVIAVEPGLNLWFQKGIGQMIRRRLQRYGIDLNSQERNQELARRSSRDDRLATVDFSSASDSIAVGLIREVLPPRWFSLLDTCRSHYGKSQQTAVKWNKFSSMGNGFTFELESLIFYAAAASVCEYLGESSAEISVFGDDVLLPKACYDLFSSFSEFLGFQVNLRKSYARGYFRESCGAYYFDGVDVKPIYIEEIARRPLQVYRLANAVRRLSNRRLSGLGCDERQYRAWKRLVDCLPKPLRLRIDEKLGDGGFISNLDESSPSRTRYGKEGYLVQHVTEVGITASSEEVGLFLARLRASSTQRNLKTSSQGGHTTLFQPLVERRGKDSFYRALHLSELAYGNTYGLRARVKLRLAKSIVSQWTDLGPWF